MIYRTIYLCSLSAQTGSHFVFNHLTERFNISSVLDLDAYFVRRKRKEIEQGRQLTQKCPVKTQDMNIIEAQDMNVIDVEDEKREKRLERDRMNARERRKRRKLHVFALEKSQARLNIENIRLQRENNVLRENVIAVSQEVSNLRDLCAMLQTSATGMTSGAETMRRELEILELLSNQSKLRSLGDQSQSTLEPFDFSGLSSQNDNTSSMVASLLASNSRLI